MVASPLLWLADKYTKSFNLAELIFHSQLTLHCTPLEASTGAFIRCFVITDSDTCSFSLPHPSPFHHSHRRHQPTTTIPGRIPFSLECQSKCLVLWTPDYLKATCYHRGPNQDHRNTSFHVPACPSKQALRRFITAPSLPIYG